jgi:hypothetical protein
VDKLNSRQREAYEQLVLSATEGITAKGLALVVNFDGGDEERKARATLEQLVKFGLAKKKEFSYQGSGGRGAVFLRCHYQGCGDSEGRWGGSGG